MTHTTTTAKPPVVDPPGTCHRVGCPGKGTKDEHVDPTAIVIGAGTWQDYTRVDHCLGYPLIKAGNTVIHAVCSISNGWVAEPRMTLTLVEMAALVDLHRAECTNRSARG